MSKIEEKSTTTEKTIITRDLDTEEIHYTFTDPKTNKKRKFKLKMSDKIIIYKIRGKNYIIPILEEIPEETK